MWQVEGAVAAFALPILLFVVESSRNERQAALRSAEVLVRESWSFPIIGFSFVVLGRMGVDLSWFPHRRLVFLSDLLLFLLTLGGALYAYQIVLRLIFSPSLLTDRARALAQEKMRRVLTRSVKVRVGNNYLFERLAASNVGYWPLPTKKREEADFLIIDAVRHGFLTDVHLEALERFVRSLAWRVPPARPQTVMTPLSQSQRGADSDPSIWLMRRYGESIPAGSLGLLRLKRSSFLDLDERALEAKANAYLHVAETDEL
jgi:hypothetical protein